MTTIEKEIVKEAMKEYDDEFGIVFFFRFFFFGGEKHIRIRTITFKEPRLFSCFDFVR